MNAIEFEFKLKTFSTRSRFILFPFNLICRSSLPRNFASKHSSTSTTSPVLMKPMPSTFVCSIFSLGRLRNRLPPKGNYHYLIKGRHHNNHIFSLVNLI